MVCIRCYWVWPSCRRVGAAWAWIFAVACPLAESGGADANLSRSRLRLPEQGVGDRERMRARRVSFLQGFGCISRLTEDFFALLFGYSSCFCTLYCVWLLAFLCVVSRSVTAN